ncbi:hypothetical protein [Nocardia sp. NPDC019395]|uniref:hypothetical protein n=1 Tax=Nocardia sp. NPDC019395 TaxID=3154686 RepID=UPI00340655D4
MGVGDDHAVDTPQLDVLSAGRGNTGQQGQLCAPWCGEMAAVLEVDACLDDLDQTTLGESTRRPPVRGAPTPQAVTLIRQAWMSGLQRRGVHLG